MTTDYIKYYDLENYVLTDVRDNFDRDGHLTAFDFFCIVIWKANRAKTKIAQRLLNYNPDLEQSVKYLTSKIFTATDDKQKLKVLIDDYKFRLPMSSAILSLLYPDNFTIYDVRVCDTLTNFKGLNNITNFENLWLGYKDYIDSVKKFEPQNLSLRDKDRFLWGKSFFEQLNNDLKNEFQK
ncbi:hypothetical protein [Flavobacterium sp.]|uniref:hypothetical protein n=1 Tax=Flavobacterium sp. TaxID=239 RepID=UPI002634BA18|nr:hypothetical protein [Flavobacterium sp.]